MGKEFRMIWRSAGASVRQARTVVLRTALVVAVVLTSTSALARDGLPANSLDHARLADAVYDPNIEFLPQNGFERVRGDKSVTGYQWAVYERKRNGRTERVLAFAGTDEIRDIGTDIGQAVTGFSLQYEQAIRRAATELARAKRDGVQLSLVGHSLGGGLAQNASAQYNIPATVFEPAGLGLINSLALELQDLFGGLAQDPDDAPVTNIQMSGDLVPVWGDQLGETYELESSFGAHSIVTVIGLLENRQLVDSWWDTNRTTAGQLDQLASARQDIIRKNVADSTLDKLAKYEAVIDVQFDNLSRFQVGAVIGGPAFVFTTPESTGGFADVVIPATSVFQFFVFDSGALEDGDIIRVELASAAGRVDFGNITLTFAGRTLPAQMIAAGGVEISVTAVNEGSASPNTGGLRILTPVTEGPSNQNFNLRTGETGRLRVIAR